MKRVVSLQFVLIIVVAVVCASAQSSNSQSLGDYARTVRKSKPAVKTVGKTYDNDNLPRTTTLSVVGKEAEASSDSEKEKKDDASQAAADSSDTKKDAQAGKDKNASADEERKKAAAEWKSKLNAQKEKVDLLSRELDVIQREYQIRAAAFYADAGNRLRNSGQWDTEDQKYKQQIADKQKALDDAKSQLSDMQEQARKSGVPNSVME